MILLVLCNCTQAASAHWTGIGLSNDEGFGDNTVSYWFSGYVYGEDGASTWFHTNIEGHIEVDGLHLKQFDFSGETMNPTFNWWALVLYGDIVSESTFASFQPIELFSYGDPPDSGGTLIETPEDFYMAFKVSEVLVGDTDYVEGMSWYGWVHVSVDENLQMTLLGEGINLKGGAVMVGAIPEPSVSVLFFIGVAILGLRRIDPPSPKSLSHG